MASRALVARRLAKEGLHLSVVRVNEDSTPLYSREALEKHDPPKY